MLFRLPDLAYYIYQSPIFAVLTRPSFELGFPSIELSVVVLTSYFSILRFF
jgi:hypothetical protein